MFLIYKKNDELLYILGGIIYRLAACFLHAKMVHLVQFLVTRSIEMQCEHLGKLIVFFVATYS